jgi:serine/threonine protein kinase
MPIAVAHTTSLDAYFKSIAQPGELQMNLKLRLCHDVANGIAELHSCGVIHGDIKLGNILLFGDLNEIESVSAKVADFSHSIVLSDYISPSNLNARPLYTGTRPFMIPEVRKQDMAMESLPLSGEPFSPIILENYRACDMYSLGILIYDIVHGGMSMSERICSIIIEKDMANNLERSGGLFVENCITYMYQLPGGLLGALKSSGLGPMKLESDVSNAVINCMDLCLQEEPNRRGEACSVVKLFSSLLETDSTLER